MMSSCGDEFLHTVPLAKETALDYYKNEADFENLLVGAYDYLQSMDQYGRMMLYIAPTILSDECFGGGGSGDDGQMPSLNIKDGNKVTLENWLEQDWCDAYIAINRANSIISNIDKVKFKDDNKKTKILAEAHFIRGYVYFVLGQTFGTCPVLTAPTAAVVGSSDSKAVFKQVFEDLKFAANNGSDDASSSNFGHANKYAAEGLIARAYLYYSGFYNQDPENCTKAEALKAVEDIIQSGKFDLVEDFNSLWPAAAQYKCVADGGKYQDAFGSGSCVYAGETNKEFIFSIRHSFTQAYSNDPAGNGFSVYLGRRNADSKKVGEQKYGVHIGWGCCGVSTAFYNSFETGDIRKTASVINHKVDFEDENFASTIGNGAREYTGLEIKKYAQTCGLEDFSKSLGEELNEQNDLMTGCPQDFVILRYADILLMQSELSETADNLNKVRERAGLDPVSYSKDALFNERAHELCFEGIRWWDLLRYDGLSGNFAYASKAVNGTFECYNNGNKTELTVNGNNVANYRYLPVPGTQIALSGYAILQNDAWK